MPPVAHRPNLGSHRLRRVCGSSCPSASSLSQPSTIRAACAGSDAAARSESPVASVRSSRTRSRPESTQPRRTSTDHRDGWDMPGMLVRPRRRRVCAAVCAGGPNAKSARVSWLVDQNRGTPCRTGRPAGPRQDLPYPRRRHRRDHHHLPRPADWRAVSSMVQVYRSQSDAEFGFRQLKDPHAVLFSPMNHWADQAIRCRHRSTPWPASRKPADLPLHRRPNQSAPDAHPNHPEQNKLREICDHTDGCRGLWSSTQPTPKPLLNSPNSNTINANQDTRTGQSDGPAQVPSTLSRVRVPGAPCGQPVGGGAAWRSSTACGCACWAVSNCC